MISWVSCQGHQACFDAELPDVAACQQSLLSQAAVMDARGDDADQQPTYRGKQMPGKAMDRDGKLMKRKEEYNA